MEPTEEPEESGAGRHWMIVLLASATIVGWGLLIYVMVKDRPREWNFGALPDAPSQSIYSTVTPPPAAESPRIFPELPEARPWQKPAAPPTAAAAPPTTAAPQESAAPTASSTPGGSP
jgi:hypothetical protein